MIMKLNLQRFAPQFGDLRINFDSHIKKVVATSTSWTKSYTWTTSGEIIPGDRSLGASYGQIVTFDVTLDDGYVIDNVTLDTAYESTLETKNDTQFSIKNGSDVLGSPITITSKKATSQLSVDLATYDIADGTHTIKLKAKAKGYKSSDLSSGVEYVKSSASAIIEKGTYVWNDTPTTDWSRSSIKSIAYKSDNASYTAMFLGFDTSGNKCIGYNVYASNSGTPMIGYITNHGWGTHTFNEDGEWVSVTTNNNLKTIIIETDQQVSQEFKTWFSANTTKQTASSFVQVSVTRTSANRSQISVSKDKIYSVQTKNMPFASSQDGITYFKYENGWTSVFETTEQIGITSSTDTSIIFTGYSASPTSDTTFYGWGDVIVLEGSKEATESDFDGFTSENNMASWACIVEDTLITLANGETKKVQDITYDDELLVWNFYEGKLDVAKPCWIKKVEIASEYNLCKFSNGSEVGFVGQGGDIGYHRIYNDELKQFTHTGVEETPNGTHTFAQDGTMPTLVSQEVIKKNVKFYNIITDKHYNLFANGILTSCKLSNKYAIKNMKYYGDLLISNEEEKVYFEKKWLKGVKQ